jgi:hypothetical protein
MCDPFTALALGGAVAGAGGKLYQGGREGAAHGRAAGLADSNAELLKTQAKIKEGNADLAVTRGNYDEYKTRLKGEHVLASETAHFAGGNVDPTYGSPLVFQGFSAAQVENDAQLVRAHMMVERANALTDASNTYAQVAGLRGKAQAERAAATTAEVSGILGAGTSLLTAGSKWSSLGGGASAGGDFASGIDFATNPFVLQQPTDL